MPRERINGPGERYGTMRSYIKAGVGFDIAARSREFERKENYEPKEVTYVSFDRHEIDVSMRPAIDRIRIIPKPRLGPRNDRF